MTNMKCGAIVCPAHFQRPFQLVKRHVLGVFLTVVMTTESGSHVVISVRSLPLTLLYAGQNKCHHSVHVANIYSHAIIVVVYI